MRTVPCSLHRVLACVVVALIGLVAPGCTRDTAPDPSARGASASVSVDAGASAAAPRKRLVLATTVEPGTLCPMTGEGAPAAELQALLFRELVVTDPSWQRVPDLAVRVPTTGDVMQDGAGLRVHWRLRGDARWSDGHPVVAEDFVVALALLRDPAQHLAASNDVLDALDHLEPDDDERGFVAVWRTHYAGFADPRVHRALPAHVVAGRDLTRDPFCRAPVGNGPFMLSRWAPGESMLFVRNPHFAPAPLLDEVLVRVLPSTDAIAAALQAGEVDATFVAGGLSPVDAAGVQRAAPDQFRLLQADGNLWVHLDFNLDDRWLRDVRVRRAIASALDLQSLLPAVSDGLYAPATSFLPTRHALFASSVRPPAFDRAQAEGLLDEAGLKRPSPGAMRVDARGQAVVLQLAAASGQRDSEQLLQFIRDALGRVGLDVRVDLKPFKVFFSEGARKRKLPHLSLYGWVVDATTTGSSLWRADRIPSPSNDFAGQNLPGWRDDVVTAALREVEVTLDPARRRSLLLNVQQRFVDALPALPLYFRPTVVVVRSDVSGVRPTGTITPLAWNAQEWDVATPRR